MKTTWKKAQRMIVAGVVAAVITAGAGQAQRLSTDYDHNADFHDLRTFSINKLQASDPLGLRLGRDFVAGRTGWWLRASGLLAVGVPGFAGAAGRVRGLAAWSLTLLRRDSVAAATNKEEGRRRAG